MTVRIAILGAGGNSLAIADAIFAINAASGAEVYALAGFFDDLPENSGRTILGAPVLGTIADAANAPADLRFINGIASVSSFRLKTHVLARSGVPPERFETIVHPRAVIARTARIGRGTAIMANSVVASEARVGDHALMLECSTVNHHASVGDHATISAGVTILGYVSVGDGAFVGGGSSIAPYVKIGDGALVGMGAAVLRDVEPGTVVAGNPARVLPDSRYKA